MFEVGRRYNFKTVDHDGYSTWNATVVAVDGSLLKLEENGKQWIFNTACSRFEQAHVNDAKPIDIGDLVVKLTNPDGTTTDYRPGAGSTGEP